MSEWTEFDVEKPPAPGVYRRCVKPGWTVHYSMWNGVNWMQSATDVDDAKSRTYPSMVQVGGYWSLP